MEIGEAVGWRAWRVVLHEDELRLASVLHDDVWPAEGPLEARCEHGHRAPDWECACGIYAAKRLELALPYRVGRDDRGTLGRVVGLVALGGDVIEHRDGWRASHARAIAISKLGLSAQPGNERPHLARHHAAPESTLRLAQAACLPGA